MEVKKKKIIRIIARLNIGGPALHSILLTKAFNTNEFESILVTGVVEKGEAQMDFLLNRYEVKPRFIPQLQRKLNPVNDILAFYKILKLIRNEKPDIVHTHTAKAGFIGRLAAFFSRVPIKVHTFHGHTFYGYFSNFRNKIFLYIERILAKITDIVIVVSPLQKEEIVRKYKIADESKCRFIFLGADLEEYLKIPLSPRLKSPIGFAESDTIIGTVGRITDIKNHRLLLEIAREFYTNYRYATNGVKFVIVGDGELRKDIEKMIDKMGLRNKVYITGWQENMVNFYSAFDIFLLTSKNEGTPMSMIEAMASGLPIVSTDVGGIPDLGIMKGDNANAGYLIKDFNKSDFAHRLNELVINRALREALGETARRTAEHMFYKDGLIANIRSLYAQLLTEKGMVR